MQAGGSWSCIFLYIELISAIIIRRLTWSDPSIATTKNNEGRAVTNDIVEDDWTERRRK